MAYRSFCSVHHRVLWGCLGVMILFGGCRTGGRTPEPVAQVGDDAIGREQLDAQVAHDLKRFGSQSKELTPAILARVQERVLRRMVEELAVNRRASAEGLAVNEEELDEAFKEHRERFRDEDTFVDYLARANTTERLLKDELKKNMLRDKLIAKLSGSATISEDEVARTYKAHPEQYLEPEQMQIRRLMLVVPNSPAKRRRVRDLAGQLASEARAHPERFAVLCRKHSAGPEASQDGDMGVVVAGRLPEFDRLLAQGLKEGAVSGVVDGGETLSLYQMTHHRPERQRPLSEVADAIRATLALQQKAEQRRQVMAQVMDEAAIRMRPLVDPALAVGTGRRPGSTKPLSPPDAGEIRPPGSTADDRAAGDERGQEAPTRGLP